MKAVFWLGIYNGFNTNILLTFQAVKNLSVYPIYLRFGLFRNFGGDFWVYLGVNSFSQKIGKIDGNTKFRRFDLMI